MHVKCHKTWLWLVSSLLLLFCVQMVRAESIPEGYYKIAQQYRVPVKVFYALLTQEAGLSTRHGFKPWPWTLNIAGKGKRYATRKAAYKALKQAVSKGITLIDIGAGQVNWRYHKDKLGSLWLALEPYHNLKVAAQILRQEFEKTGRSNWWTAVGRYHSPGGSSRQIARANRYVQQVKRRYRQIDKV